MVERFRLFVTASRAGGLVRGIAAGRRMAQREAGVAA
jgi:hypothetical protein